MANLITRQVCPSPQYTHMCSNVFKPSTFPILVMLPLKNQVIKETDESRELHQSIWNRLEAMTSKSCYVKSVKMLSYD